MGWFRHDDRCERAAPDDACGCRRRQAEAQVVVVNGKHKKMTR